MTSIRSKSHLHVRAGRRSRRGSGVGNGMSRKDRPVRRHTRRPRRGVERRSS